MSHLICLSPAAPGLFWGISPGVLHTAIKTYIGSLDFGVNIISKDGQTAAARPVLKVAMSVLDEHLDKGLELLSEILQKTRFDSADSIRRIVLQADEEGKQNAVMAGHLMAVYAVQAHYTARAAVNEAINREGEIECC